MDEVTPNPAVLKGSMFYKLIQRALPGWFKYNSIYLWQPMYTPGKNIELAIDQKKIKEFTNRGGAPSQAVLKRSFFYKMIQLVLPGWLKSNWICLWLTTDKPAKKIEAASKLKTFQDLVINDSKPKNPKGWSAQDIIICEQIMEVQKNLKTFKNPAFLELERLEDGPVLDFLKEINNQAEDVEEYSFEKLGGREPELFEYFAELAKNMLHNERLEWTADKDKLFTWQIDIIRECVILISFVPY
jgi:hypothetical protein